MVTLAQVDRFPPFFVFLLSAPALVQQCGSCLLLRSVVHHPLHLLSMLSLLPYFLVHSVLWSSILISQIVLNYRRSSTQGFSAGLAFMWTVSALLYLSFAVVTDQVLLIPIQNAIFLFCCLVTIVQVSSLSILDSVSVRLRPSHSFHSLVFLSVSLLCFLLCLPCLVSWSGSTLRCLGTLSVHIWTVIETNEKTVIVLEETVTVSSMESASSSSGSSSSSIVSASSSSCSSCSGSSSSSSPGFCVSSFASISSWFLSLFLCLGVSPCAREAMFLISLSCVCAFTGAVLWLVIFIFQILSGMDSAAGVVVMSVFGSIVPSVTYVIGYFPQYYELFTRKNSNGLSFGFQLIDFFASLFGVLTIWLSAFLPTAPTTSDLLGMLPYACCAIAQGTDSQSDQNQTNWSWRTGRRGGGA